MSSHKWPHIAAFVILIGVLSATLGARALGAVEVANVSLGASVPEPAELGAVGVILVSLAASTRRVAGREEHP